MKSDLDSLRVATMTMRLRAPWAHSLKEKRMIVQSLVSRLQGKFHVSAAEIAAQDSHQDIVLGVAAIVPGESLASQLLEKISSFVEANTEAEIVGEERELR